MTFHFLDLHLEDSGMYTCTAKSESGETSWSSWLTVSFSSKKICNLNERVLLWVWRRKILFYQLALSKKCCASQINFWLLLRFFNQVEKSSTSTLRRMPDISMLPSSPSEPKLVNVTSTSVTLAWNKVQQKQGGSSSIGYTVEYFSSDLQSGWVTAAQRIPSNVVTVCIKV